MNISFTALLAEDDPNDRRLFHLAMRRNHKPVSIHEANDGMEVLEYFKGEGKFHDRLHFPIPDLVIVDLKMPRMNGLEVVSWLRKQPVFTRLPIVMLSGSGLDKDVLDAYRLGVNSYFKKPSDFSVFIKVLGTIFDYWLLAERSHVHEHFADSTVRGFTP